MTVLKRDTHHHTYADYLTWSREYGDELINGTAYIREPPSPTRLHQEIVAELAYQLTRALEGKPCRVYVAPRSFCKDGGAQRAPHVWIQGPSAAP